MLRGERAEPLITVSDEEPRRQTMKRTPSGPGGERTRMSAGFQINVSRPLQMGGSLRAKRESAVCGAARA